ncbi:MAG: UDP-glucose/GDP-mannose dehydrogenase family protein [Arenimonas sp.]|nr:UDP-glucose/GDP-mannose dehydrogenase family protein [Arenimonas sp.]
MKISVFGTGYVGLVTGACLAEMGNQVVCVDIDSKKIEGLNNGQIPIFEPGLTPMVVHNHHEGRLKFTTDAQAAVEHGDIIFIAVGTPPDEDGSADMKYVLAVANTIGQHLTRYAVVVNKSTVPVGTADKVQDAIAQQLKKLNSDVSFDVVSNPEFLKEGDAVKDCMRPDRIVIGSKSIQALDQMKRLYAPFNRNHDRIVAMDIRSAELTKYAANAMLATKISFMNEMANIAERVGADIEMVRHGIGSDPRIGYSFIYPGAGYGGSCFPKDVQALEHTAKQFGYQAQILGAVEAVNNQQKDKLFELISSHFPDGIVGKTFAVWGLAFKPNTDDMRAASSRNLLASLWAAGAKVQAFDPEAMLESERIFGHREDLLLVGTANAALQNADALVVVTEWKNFQSPDFHALKNQLADAVLFDGRNIYDPATVEAAGIAYYGIGRGRSIARNPV